MMDAQSTSILDLNDDCLFEICKYISIDELINLEAVCKRFKAIAIQRYHLYKSYRWKCDNGQCLKLLPKIGPYLRTFCLAPNCFQEEIDRTIQSVIQTLTDCCTVLTDITFQEMSFTRAMNDNLAKLFMNVEKLRFKDCNIDSFDEDVFLAASKLRDIRLIRCDFTLNCIMPLKNLEIARFSNSSEHLDVIDIEIFLRNNPILRCLSIGNKGYDGDEEHESIWARALCNTNPINLTELQLRNFKDLSWVPSLSNLKYLALGLQHNKVDELLKAINNSDIQLYGLNLYRSQITETSLNAIERMHTLRTLRINFCELTVSKPEKGVIRFQKLAQLEKLHLVYMSWKCFQENCIWIIKYMRNLRIFNLTMCQQIDSDFLNLIETEFRTGADSFNRDNVLNIYVYETTLDRELSPPIQLSHPKFRICFSLYRFPNSEFMNAKLPTSP